MASPGIADCAVRLASGITGAASLDFSTGFSTGLSIVADGASPLPSIVIATRKPLSTMTTTLAPTSSERMRDVILDPPWAAWALARAALLSAATRPGFSRACSFAGFAAACAARRAAAMKLDVLAASRAAWGISLSAFSDAAMRCDGVAGAATRSWGRVPGSSGVSGGRSGSIGKRAPVWLRSAGAIGAAGGLSATAAALRISWIATGGAVGAGDATGRATGADCAAAGFGRSGRCGAIDGAVGRGAAGIGAEMAVDEISGASGGDA